MSTRVTWVSPPTRLTKNFLLYAGRIIVATRAVADFIAQKMQSEARQNAPWEDRTGNARSGLLGLTEMAAHDMIHIYLTHTMWYGVFLELARGGRYAVIMPTIEANLPALDKMLKGIFK